MAKQIAQAAPAGTVHPSRRQPAEPYGEEELKHQAEPEDRHGQAEVAEERGDVVEDAVWRRAAKMPKTSAETREISSPAAMRMTVLGKTSQITCETGRNWLYETPRSPRKICVTRSELLVRRAVQTHTAADVCQLLGRHAPIAGEKRVGPARRQLHEDE